MRDLRSSCLPRAVRIDLQARQHKANAIESENLDVAFPVCHPTPFPCIGRPYPRGLGVSLGLGVMWRLKVAMQNHPAVAWYPS